MRKTPSTAKTNGGLAAIESLSTHSSALSPLRCALRNAHGALRSRSRTAADQSSPCAGAG